MTALFYVLAYVALPLFGWWLARGIDDRAAKVAWAFMAGVVLLTIEATVFSMARVPWTWWGLGIPLVILSGAQRSRRISKYAASHFEILRFAQDDGILLLATLHFLLSILTTQSVSPDYLLFWGVKGARYALARGIDPAWLFRGYSPPQPDYPPLVPVFQGWGVLFTREMPWLAGAAMSAAWLLAAAFVLRWLLGGANNGGNDGKDAIAFWTAAMALSFAATGCGGNAEAMLIAYLSVGAAAVVVDRRVIAMIAFAGAALTKAEALFAIATILAGLALRELLRRDREGIKRLAMYGAATIGGIGVWFAYQFRFGREIGFHRFSSIQHFYWSNLAVIAHEGPKNLGAGAWGVPWLLALGVVVFIAIRAPRRIVDALPLLVPVPLFFAFFLFLYLQYASGLTLQLAWTLGRISQPPLSFLILGAAFVSSRGVIESARHEP